MEQFPILGQPDTGDTAWMLASAARSIDDARSGVLLRWHGARQRRAQHDHDEHQRHGRRHRAVGAVRLPMAFGNDKFSLFGDPTQYFGFERFDRRQRRGGGSDRRRCRGRRHPVGGHHPQTVFVAFQLMFAIITVALISGSVADQTEVRRLADRRTVGDVRVFPGRPLRSYSTASPLRTVAGSPTSSGRSTSPAGRRCISTPAWRACAGDHPRQANGLAGLCRCAA